MFWVRGRLARSPGGPPQARFFLHVHTNHYAHPFTLERPSDKFHYCVARIDIRTTNTNGTAMENALSSLNSVWRSCKSWDRYFDGKAHTSYTKLASLAATAYCDHERQHRMANGAKNGVTKTLQHSRNPSERNFKPPVLRAVVPSGF